MTKVLFIDVDGPLIPARALFLPENLQRAWTEQWTFDPCAVGMLNFLFWAVPDLRAVVSSHRVGCAAPKRHAGLSTFSREFWEAIFAENGLRAELHVDWITPRRLSSRPKIQEISDWLAKHPEVECFAVIEDNFNGDEPITLKQIEQFHVVALNYGAGLTYSCFISLAQKYGLAPKELNSLYLAYVTEMGVKREA